MGPIIRTCSLAAFALLATPLAAQVADNATLDAYVQGRLLDAAGAGSEAALAYSAALSGAPTEERIANRAFAQALEAGDKALALRAARALDNQAKLSGDGRLLLYIDAVSRNDWRGAGLQLDKMDGGNFDFLVPIFRAWVATGARDANPLASLDVRPLQALTGAYAREQRVYLLLALKRADEGKTLARALASSDPRSVGMRIAAAARLAQIRDRDGGISLLESGDKVTALARSILVSGKMLEGAIVTPADAAGMLMARLASDLLRDNASATALRLARLAAFAAPDNAEVALVLSQAMSAAGFQQPALATLALWNDEPLFGASRREVRFGALQRLGRDDEALAMAKAAADSPDADLFDHARLGDALSTRRDFAMAATAYRKAIDRAEARDAYGPATWNLWLLYGGALDSAGDWANAKPALQKAVSLGPDQPGALNHLGYAMLERRDDMAEATRLIAKAASLKPDDAAITDSLGWAFYLRGQTAESIAVLERAVAADPTEAALGEHLGDAYWSAGRRIDARYAWNAALIQAIDNEAIMKRIVAKIADGLQ